LLTRRGVIDKAEAQQLIETSTAERLHAGGAEGYKAIWSDLKADEKALPDIALAAAAIQSSLGNHEEASKILEAAINVRLEPRLLNAYSQCPPEHVARRYSKAEEWLKAHPDDSALLAALGNLCLTGELWGQGEYYLLRSMKIRSDMRIHALLGNLYDRLGRPADAMKHWRLASGVAGSLPVLPLSKLLPAADTRGDPTLVDVAAMPSAQASASMQAPLAASAADFVSDEDLAESPLPATDTPPPATPARDIPSMPADDIDEYFDSAPIPGVDVSQTSDRPHRNRDNH
jgi:HemY protein